MMLAELSDIPTWDLPIAQFRSHLRLGSGFSDDAFQDSVLESCLRGGLAAIEARTGKALYQRGFRWTLTAWRSPGVQALPVAPVDSITGIKTITRGGDEFAVDLSTVQLVVDSQRPRLQAVGASLPAIPTGGSAEVSFVAGYSPDWVGLPSDLAQAVMMLAAHYYEVRHEQPMNDGNMPFGVSSLIDRYRTVRILGGAAH
jgi:uncharacterized phiE125 gp8 family phage protein